MTKEDRKAEQVSRQRIAKYELFTTLLKFALHLSIRSNFAVKSVPSRPSLYCFEDLASNEVEHQVFSARSPALRVGNTAIARLNSIFGNPSLGFNPHPRLVVYLQNTQMENYEIRRRHSFSSFSPLVPLPITNDVTIRSSSWFGGASHVNIHGGTFNETIYNAGGSRHGQHEIERRMDLLEEKLLEVRIAQEDLRRQQDDTARKEDDLRRLQDDLRGQQGAMDRREESNRRRMDIFMVSVCVMFFLLLRERRLPK
ncbi:hypothetical protein CVT26_011873 [Gymnopilus dilepis]|uniref:Uncharacterized protein n=1 Tax=Gymnopilus dilepis TaxID=231916 RepID=A0A409YH94_9AGAR|nr:hypothetical protein CVT26_011873 [Gymnopilus dilepis]